MNKKYECLDCHKKFYMPENFSGRVECPKCKGVNKKFVCNSCPICGKALTKKHEGWICKNWQCDIGGFKLGVGWVYIKPKFDFKELWEQKFQAKLHLYENAKKWALKKSEVLRRDKFYCQICCESNSLEVHHILPKSTHPELTFDDENLITICKECHKKMHAQDKWRFD